MTVLAPTLRQLSARVISEATGASVRSAQRWRAGAMPRRLAYRVRLDEAAATLELLGPGMSARARQAWMTGQSAYLGWRRPVDLLAAGEFDRVKGAALAYAAGDIT